jgi:hypothetical protein
MVKYSPRLYHACAVKHEERRDRAMFYMFGAQEGNPDIDQSVMHAQGFAALITENLERNPNLVWEGYKTYFRRYQIGLPIDMSADYLVGVYALNRSMAEVDALLKPLVDEAESVFGPVETGLKDDTL